MEKFLYPTHPVQCIMIGPSAWGESVFLTILILNIINEYDEKYTPTQQAFIKICIKS